MNSNIELYHFERCPYCEKARRALRYLNLEYESHLVSPGDRSKVVEVSGQEGVPVIVDQGKVIYDSTVIVEYLDEQYAVEAQLIPSRKSERGKAYLLNSFAEEVWGPLTSRALLKIDADGNRLDEPGQEKLQESINDHAAILDLFFDQREFAVNGSVTIADFALSAFPSRIINHSIFDIPPSLDNFWGWFDRLGTRLKVSVDTE